MKELICPECGGGLGFQVHRTKEFIKIFCKWCFWKKIIESEVIDE